MTQFYWVRHGPTHAKSFVGWRDIPADLSDTQSLIRLADHLPAEALIVSSDLVRSSATADAIGRARQRLPNDARLREFDFGDWDGLHFTEVSETHPDLSRAYWETPGNVAPPNGESWNTAAARINDAVDDLLIQSKGRPVIVVAHFGAILTQVARADGQGAYAALGHKIDNLSVTDVTWDSTRWTLGRINHIA